MFYCLLSIFHIFFLVDTIFSPFVSVVIRGWLARKQFNSMHKMKQLTHENSNSKRKPGKKILEVKVHINVIIMFQLDLFIIFPIVEMFWWSLAFLDI